MVRKKSGIVIFSLLAFRVKDSWEEHKVSWGFRTMTHIAKSAAQNFGVDV